jgi:hypothetical protein
MRAAAIALACLLLAPLAAQALAPHPLAQGDRGAVLLAALRAPSSDPLRAGLAVASVAAGLPVPVVPRGSLDAAEVWLLAEGVPLLDARAARDALANVQPDVRGALLDTVAAFAAFEAAARIAPNQVEGPRLGLLAAAVALRDALGGRSLPLRIQAPPVFAIDLVGASDVYVADVALLLDVGGNDLYLNNAGGTSAGDACPIGGSVMRPASALIDLAGDDRYVSGRRCGINGGGWFGAGFLLDAAGNDAYSAYTNGVNGGGVGGAGFLLDVGGDDAYSGDAVGVNGGGGIFAGRGFLLDLSGNDRYTGGALAVNGGGSTNGVGLLLDADGDDAYVATQIGVNGGGWLGGQGTLVDASGDDTYTAGLLAVNGAGGGLEFGQPGVGLLLDGAGGDRYDDLEGGTGDDVTVAPKGIAGAQLDLAG